MIEETVIYEETDEEPLLDAPEDYGWTDGVTWHPREDGKDELATDGERPRPDFDPRMDYPERFVDKYQL